MAKKITSATGAYLDAAELAECYRLRAKMNGYRFEARSFGQLRRDLMERAENTANNLRIRRPRPKAKRAR